MTNIEQLKQQLKNKIFALDKEEAEIRAEFKRGLWKSEKRRRFKNFIRWNYVQMIRNWLPILEILGGEEDFVKELKGDRCC